MYLNVFRIITDKRAFSTRSVFRTLKPFRREVSYNSIFRNTIIKRENINLSGILNTGAGYSVFGESVKRILMKSAYIGKDPFKELKGFIDKKIVYYEKDEEFMRELAL